MSSASDTFSCPCGPYKTSGDHSMKALLFDPDQREIAGDFDPPPLPEGITELRALRLHYEPGGGRIAMKIVPGGAGVWDRGGKLLRSFPRGADVDWHPTTGELWLLEEGFGRCSQRRGIRHELKSLDPRTLDSAAVIEVCVPTGGPEYLVMSNGGRTCLATWLEQGSWGYVTIDFEAARQTGPAFSYSSSTVSPPAYSLDDHFIVACNLWKEGWWTDEEDYWDVPSPGGLRTLSIITVQDVRTNAVSRHTVAVVLPVGWRPPDSEASDWQTIWGPKFISATEFETMWPDGGRERMALPLPPQIVFSSRFREGKLGEG